MKCSPTADYRVSLSWIYLCCLILVLVTADVSSTSMEQATQVATLGESNAIISYDFLMVECNANAFIDKSGINSVGSLYRLSHSESCLPSNGVSGEAKIVSKNSITALKTLLGTNDYSIELWLQPQINPSAPLSFMSIGVDTIGSKACSNNLMLSQAGSGASMSTAGFVVAVCNQNMISSGNAMASPSYSIKLVNGRAKMMHVVVVLTHSSYTFGSKSAVIHEVSANYTVDGTTSDIDQTTQYFVSPSRLDPSSWDPTGKLNLFPTLDMLSSTNARSAGNVYHLAMYNKALTFAEIQQRYQSPLPNSLPVVQNATVTVQENGEVGDHSDDPAFYDSSIPSDQLVVLLLQAYDFDNDPINPNYDPDRDASATRLYLRALSLSGLRGGLLYHLNGTILGDGQHSSDVEVPYDEQLHGYAIRYRPPLNQYSASNEAISTFLYYAVDGITKLSSLSDAEMSIHVVHVDKPPVPRTGIAVGVVAGVSSILLLSGTDPDSRIVAARIHTLPNSGSLHRIHPNGSIDVLAESSKDIIITAQPFKVAYIYTGGQTALVGRQDGAVGFDSFEFTMVDVEGRESRPGLFQLVAYTSLTARPSVDSDANPMADQHTLCNVTVYGADESHVGRDLFIRILSGPAHGTLYRRTDRSELQALTDQEILDRPLSHGSMEILYQSSGDYFTSPDTSYDGRSLVRSPDYFDFQVIAKDGAASISTRQYIRVRNVNQPTHLSFAYSDQYATAGKVVVYAEGAPTGNGKDASLALIRGFQVVDEDLDVGLIRVSVSTKHGGIVSLNASALPELDFNSNEFCFGDTAWICRGDGVSDTAMSFVATPSAAARAINGLTYESLRPNIHDNITVTFFDGAGENCLSSGQQSSASIREGCFLTSATVSVTVLGYYGIDSSNALSNSNSSLSQRLQYVALALIVIASIAVLRCLYFRWCSRGTEVASKAALESSQQHKDVQKDIESLNKVVQALTDNLSRLKDRDDDDHARGGICSVDGLFTERDERPKDGGRVRQASKTARSKDKKGLKAYRTTTTTSAATSTLPTQTMAINFDKLLSEVHRNGIGSDEILNTEVETAADGSQVLHISVPLQKQVSAVGGGGGSRAKRTSRKKLNTTTSALATCDDSSTLTTQSCVTAAASVWTRAPISAEVTCNTEPLVSADHNANRYKRRTRKGGGDTSTHIEKDDLRPVWEMHLSKTGRPFFRNNITKESTWNPPMDLLNVVDR